jgi:hypothetical protein
MNVRFSTETDMVKGSGKPTILLRLCRAMPSADQLDVSMTYCTITLQTYFPR